ncbi:Rha family transcriptional regulator [Methylobacterium sp. WSM2598]|uniref:Rha family transcriptional regulator n=1 Tax=Methylobacterium sp. WSM2598 TaxID=398261 RepID=UPI000A062603|nr:Rha family transcriptional regulator [Methylobacterium sp. WSM2598]
MSSLEIADLTGKEHRSVVRDIRVMCEELGVSLLTFERCYRAGNGRDELCCYLPKRAGKAEGPNVRGRYVRRHSTDERWPEVPRGGSRDDVWVRQRGFVQASLAREDRARHAPLRRAVAPASVALLPAVRSPALVRCAAGTDDADRQTARLHPS